MSSKGLRHLARLLARLSPLFLLLFIFFLSSISTRPVPVHTLDPLAMDTLAELRAGQLVGVTKLNLKNAGLTTLPSELVHLASTLQHLDLSSNPISHLPSPEHFPYELFTKLKIVFFTDCHFVEFPAALTHLPAISMVSFRSNGMHTIAEGALPSTLRWGIFTNNALTSLPSDIGRLSSLEKFMLAGNQLSTLPDSMSECHSLTLLRISANNFETFPSWLFKLPNLSFLAFSGNPATMASRAHPTTAVPDIYLDSLTVGKVLGEGASGIITMAEDEDGKQVAVKTFKSTSITSDGSPLDEMTASLIAGSHPNLVSVLGRLIESKEKDAATLGLVLELVPPEYANLGLPPTFDTCTRDVFNIPPLSTTQALNILLGIAQVAIHLHERGISHGDLYAHNILFSPTSDDGKGDALLGDFGAATVYGTAFEHAKRVERLEVRAFGYLVEDVAGLIGVGDEGESVKVALREVASKCTKAKVGMRPTFREVKELLDGITA